MNRLEIIGHIGQDAVVKDLGTNQVINFTVAVSETYTNKTTNEKITNTTWFDCAKWGNSTQIAQYLKKGTQVYVSGKPNPRAWQNEGGEIKVVNGITVNDVKLLGSKQSDSSTQQAQSSSQPANTPTDNQEKPQNAEEPDDLPF